MDTGRFGRWRAAAVVGGAAVVAAGIVACSEEGPVNPLADCLAAAGAGEAAIAISGFAFSPDTLRVSPGTRVTWVNCEDEDVDAHTATSDVGLWDSGFLSPGEVFSRDFDATGSFPYHCVPHPFMEAVVIVEGA